MKKILVIFDCDGTLVESEAIACKVFPEYWATHGVYFTRDEFKEKFIGIGHNAPIVVETFAKMPQHAEAEGDRLLDEAISRYLEPVSGMSEVLSQLGCEMCVASNSSKQYVATALKTVGFDALFDNRVFSSRDVENPKPAPDVFLHASRHLGFLPEDCIVVEDSSSGVLAAKLAGMRVIGFTGASHFVPRLVEKLLDVKPHWHCATTDELKATLTKHV